MSTVPGTITISSAAELVPISEVARIETYEVRGQRLDPDPDREPSNSLHVMGRIAGRELETRVRMEQITSAARLYADIGVIFEVKGDVEIEQDAFREFTERVGVMAVFPFLRESVFTSASRLGVEAPVVGLLRAGQFRLHPPEDLEQVEPGGEVPERTGTSAGQDQPS